MGLKRNSKSSVSLVISEPNHPRHRIILKGGRWFPQRRWLGIWWNMGSQSITGYSLLVEAEWVLARWVWDPVCSKAIRNAHRTMEQKDA